MDGWLVGWLEKGGACSLYTHRHRPVCRVHYIHMRKGSHVGQGYWTVRASLPLRQSPDTGCRRTGPAERSGCAIHILLRPFAPPPITVSCKVFTRSSTSISTTGCREFRASHRIAP